MERESISDIKNKLSLINLEDLKFVIKDYETDERVGVKKVIESYQRKIKAHDVEIKRVFQMHRYERQYSEYKYICGIDEVGRGPLAGPVVTAAVILPKDIQILYVNDSKKLTGEKREALYKVIQEKAIDISVGIVNKDIIDEINILNGTYEAMKSAIRQLKIQPDVILVDAVTIPDITIPQEPIIKGDEKSISIAASSIIAKVTRDKMMVQYDELFPEYQFAKNKGYGTKEHIEALKKYGPCPIHRQSFIKNII